MPNKLTPRRLIILAGPQAWGRQTATDLISNSGLRRAQYLRLEAADKALEIYNLLRHEVPDAGLPEDFELFLQNSIKIFFSNKRINHSICF